MNEDSTLRIWSECLGIILGTLMGCALFGWLVYIFAMLLHAVTA